jgi:predicted nuclease with RNAse H fold
MMQCGGNVKNAAKVIVFGMLSFVGVGLLLSGCKSVPELTKAQAQALIQAKYDQTPAVGANISVDQTGLARGVTAKYWQRTKLYPNGWGDFTLTPEGKKVFKLQKGGEVIEWHPANAGDKNFTFVVVTVAANHLKAQNLSDPQDDLGSTKTASFVETVSLEGVPTDLKVMADGVGNRLSSKHMATFALEGGAWKLQSIN